MSQPSFTIEEAAALGVSRHHLAYYVRTGDLRLIGPGRYCDPTRPVLTDWKWEDLLRIVTSVEGGIVCGLSALDLHDLTDEIPREHWIAIPKEMKKPEIAGVRFVRTSHLALGQTRLKLEVYEVPVFDKERAVVDAFRLLSREVAIKSLQRLAKQGPLDFQKLNSYARTLRVKIEDFLLAAST
ncbi:MAG: hypothetical protein IOD12_09660 [Silvanigrellales bacterium]|jgi:predicted transcriptional regulator of viral defense system|nr:hypothetical protein [Silvanigrellales bacterium]